MLEHPTDVFFRTIVQLTNSNWLISKPISAYLRSIASGANNTIVRIRLARIYSEQGLLNLAIDTLRCVIELDPNFYDAHYNLAYLLHRNGQITESEKYYNTVLALCPTHENSLYNLALIKSQKSHKKEAIMLHMRALEINPDFTEAHYDLATILNEEGNISESLNHYQEVLRINPTSINAYIYLGNMYKNMGDDQKALEFYFKALSINPEYAIAYNNIANIYQHSGNIPGAIHYYKTTLQLQSNNSYAFFNLQFCLLRICDWTDYELRMEKMISVIVENLKNNDTVNIEPFYSLIYPLSHDLRKAISNLRANKHLNNIKSLRKPPYKYLKELAPSNRLRIGYVSSDYLNHPTMHLTQSIFGLHNKSNVEIFCYSLSKNDNSEFRSKIIRESEHFKDLSNITCNGEAADIINRDGIHILVNMNGYTKGERSEIFALRPAPIQVMWVGYPGTSGSPFMDYIITDMVTSPVEYEYQYSEKLAYMPHAFLPGDHYQMFPHLCDRIILSKTIGNHNDVADNVAVLNGIDLTPIVRSTDIKEIKRIIHSETTSLKVTESTEVILKILELSNFTNIETMIASDKNVISINGIDVKNGKLIYNTNYKISLGQEVMQNIVITTRTQYGLPEDVVLYCCFNQLHKIDPIIFQIWVNILKAVPKSVLWLLRFPVHGENFIYRTASSFGIETNRIIFTDTGYKEEHVRRAQLADVCLDTLFFNGHTTSMDVLWSGTPIVTLPGETFASRVAASLLTTLGLPELVARTKEDYQNIAIRLGTDKEYLRTTRAKVWKNRLDSPLFNCSMYANDLERLYGAMWEKYQHGENPDHILSLRTY